MSDLKFISIKEKFNRKSTIEMKEYCEKALDKKYIKGQNEISLYNLARKSAKIYKKYIFEKNNIFNKIKYEVRKSNYKIWCHSCVEIKNNVLMLSFFDSSFPSSIEPDGNINVYIQLIIENNVVKNCYVKNIERNETSVSADCFNSILKYIPELYNFYKKYEDLKGCKTVLYNGLKISFSFCKFIYDTFEITVGTINPLTKRYENTITHNLNDNGDTIFKLTSNDMELINLFKNKEKKIFKNIYVNPLQILPKKFVSKTITPFYTKILNKIKNFAFSIVKRDII